MILPKSGAGLPAWRRNVSTWTMSALRLLVAWIVAHQPVLNLVGAGRAFTGEVASAPVRWAIAAALVAGGLLFAWSRTVLAGGALLLAGLAGFEWVWRRLGMPPGDTFLWSAALIVVLAAGEWLVRRVQRRVYDAPPRA